MEYNIENIKLLVKILRNKKDSSVYLKDKALRIYYSNINTIDITREESKYTLMPFHLFETLTKRFIDDEIIPRKNS
jgi:hypothetical protein